MQLRLRRALLPLAALCLTLAVSCGPSFRHVQEKSVTEAEYLRAEVIASGLQGGEIAIANDYLAKAKLTSSAKDAADYADLAAAHYRVALARHSLDASGRTLDGAEAALKESEEQVDKYKRILADMGSRRATGGE